VSPRAPRGASDEGARPTPELAAGQPRFPASVRSSRFAAIKSTTKAATRPDKAATLPLPVPATAPAGSAGTCAQTFTGMRLPRMVAHEALIRRRPIRSDMAVPPGCGCSESCANEMLARTPAGRPRGPLSYPYFYPPPIDNHLLVREFRVTEGRHSSRCCGLDR
jgi:hypothetical protein